MIDLQSAKEWRFWWAGWLRNLDWYPNHDAFERAEWRKNMRRCAHWYAVNRGWRNPNAEIA